MYNQLEETFMETFGDEEVMNYFKEMKEIKVVDPDDFGELYKVVRIDTPVGPYFLRFLEANLAEIGENCSMNDI